MQTVKGFPTFSDGPSTDKDPEEKKKESAMPSQNSPEAREERYFTLSIISSMVIFVLWGGV
jgi:hypothetical protein